MMTMIINTFRRIDARPPARWTFSSNLFIHFHLYLFFFSSPSSSDRPHSINSEVIRFSFLFTVNYDSYSSDLLSKPLTDLESCKNRCYSGCLALIFCPKNGVLGWCNLYSDKSFVPRAINSDEEPPTLNCFYGEKLELNSERVDSIARYPNRDCRINDKYWLSKENTYCEYGFNSHEESLDECMSVCLEIRLCIGVTFSKTKDCGIVLFKCIEIYNSGDDSYYSIQNCSSPEPTATETSGSTNRLESSARSSTAIIAGREETTSIDRKYINSTDNIYPIEYIPSTKYINSTDNISPIEYIPPTKYITLNIYITSTIYISSTEYISITEYISPSSLKPEILSESSAIIGLISSVQQRPFQINGSKSLDSEQVEVVTINREWNEPRLLPVSTRHVIKTIIPGDKGITSQQINREWNEPRLLPVSTRHVIKTIIPGDKGITSQQIGHEWNKPRLLPVSTRHGIKTIIPGDKGITSQQIGREWNEPRLLPVSARHGIKTIIPGDKGITSQQTVPEGNKPSEFISNIKTTTLEEFVFQSRSTILKKEAITNAIPKWSFRMSTGGIAVTVIFSLMGCLVMIAIFHCTVGHKLRNPFVRRRPDVELQRNLETKKIYSNQMMLDQIGEHNDLYGYGRRPLKMKRGHHHKPLMFAHHHKETDSMFSSNHKKEKDGGGKGMRSSTTNKRISTVMGELHSDVTIDLSPHSSYKSLNSLRKSSIKNPQRLSTLKPRKASIKNPKRASTLNPMRKSIKNPKRASIPSPMRTSDKNAKRLSVVSTIKTAPDKIPERSSVANPLRTSIKNPKIKSITSHRKSFITFNKSTKIPDDKSSPIKIRRKSTITSKTNKPNMPNGKRIQ